MSAPDPHFLSTKEIPPEERLIFALDVPEVAEARRLVETLREAVSFYKVGLELFMTGEAFALIDWLHGRGAKVSWFQAVRRAGDGGGGGAGGWRGGGSC